MVVRSTFALFSKTAKNICHNHGIWGSNKNPSLCSATDWCLLYSLSMNFTCKTVIRFSYSYHILLSHSGSVRKPIPRICITHKKAPEIPLNPLNCDQIAPMYYFLLPFFLDIYFLSKLYRSPAPTFLGVLHGGRSTALKINPAIWLSVVFKCYHSYKYLNNIILCNRSISKLKKPVSPEWPAWPLTSDWWANSADA